MCECLHKEGCWHYINKDLCGNKSWLLKKKKKTEASSHFSGMKELLHSGLVGGIKYLLSFIYWKGNRQNAPLSSGLLIGI